MAVGCRCCRAILELRRIPETFIPTSDQPGKGSHLKVFLNGRQAVLPMHGKDELGKGLETAIKRQLGLK